MAVSDPDISTDWKWGGGFGKRNNPLDMYTVVVCC